VIIHDFYIVGVAIVPDKANTPLIVDTYAVLPCSIAFQCFQMITRRRPQITKFGGNIQLAQLSLGHSLESSKAFHSLPAVELFGLARPKRLDHPASV
jgi:hypothetical protein